MSLDDVEEAPPAVVGAIPPGGGAVGGPQGGRLWRIGAARVVDSGPDARQTLTTAIFARTDVLGFERMEYELTPDAIALGLDAALPAVFELREPDR